ncbi:MAG: tRNA-uridine 2-sulfurtransferase [Thermoleophilaceae bacterium]|nr:tRNA-uridine 2-sulfurtransferase [Thermoleophilaceae bacterium]
MDDVCRAFEEHLSEPRGRGALAGAPDSGAAGGAACGDLIRVAVRVEDGVVAEAGFDASGCGAVVAAGSAVVELVSGAPLLDAARVGPNDIAEELGGLLPGKAHAASLAADALHRALGAFAKHSCDVDGNSYGQRRTSARRRTLVAMSGGVDSAVAAQLALEAGDDVVAVTLELWSDPNGDGSKSCCSPQALTGARALAHRMGIPHITLDLREQFRREVVDDFVAAYEAGRTPNPCVRCNGLVRFGEMLALADAVGADRLATGHYARIVQDEQGPLLEAANDGNKDQAYMLARLAPGDLRRLWFPLGEMLKPQVRELARQADLPVAAKPDSQDLCFLAGIRKTDLLERMRTRPPKPGKVVTLDGTVLTEHAGIDRFTIGQRRGVGVANGAPLYVVGKDPESGRVTVGPREALAVQSLDVTAVELYRDASQIDGVKLRYRSPAVGCSLPAELPAGRYPRIAVMLNEPFIAAAPGQVACFMSGDRVVGHGLIAETEIADAA